MIKKEKEFQELLRRIPSKNDKSHLTEYQKIWLVIKSQPKKRWWIVPDLMGYHNIDGKSFYLGYETSARLSEICKQRQFESRQAKKYKARYI